MEADDPSDQAILNPGQAAREPFLPVIRELARSYQAFAAYSARHVRQLDLTPPQFDVISTLGNTSGMSMHTLGNQTLITKGTLTGIIDRLEQKGLVRRDVPPGNRRSFIVRLTTTGEEVFEQVFPAHIVYLGRCLRGVAREELEQMEAVLKRLRLLFEAV